MPTTTNNMSLKIPIAGETDYSTSVSDSFTAIDTHDHSSAKGTQIVTGGITDLAVTTAKINDLAVTTGKLAANAVTRAKMASVGQQVSSSCGAFGTTSTTAVDVTNLSVSITTTGRPVVIALVPDGSDVGRIGIEFSASSSSGGEGFFKLLEAGVEIAAWSMKTAAGSASVTNPELYVPCGSIFFVRPVAAGTYTYKLQAYASSNYQTSVINCKLVAYEL
jgi:hypothetical protein